MFEFVVLPGFAKAWRKLKLGQAAFESLLAQLTDNPETGDVIPGSDGFRKLRIKLPGRGKRGGGRVIYAVINIRMRILLGAVYSKAERDDLSQDELVALKKARNNLNL